MTANTAGRIRPLPLPIVRRWLADGWRGMIGWALGIIATLVLYLPIYPSMQSPELNALLDSLPEELVRTLGYESITTGAGYTEATFFGLVGFVLVAIAGIAWGAAYTGGAEESGRLELTLSHAVGRVSYAVQSASALLIKLVILGGVAYVTIWLLDGPSELALDAANLLAATGAWVGLGLFVASAAFAGGALTGRRVWGIGAGALVAVIGYVLQALANNSDDFAVLRDFSPYGWAFGSSPLADGADWVGLALLWGGALVLIAVGTAALSRRDILG